MGEQIPIKAEIQRHLDANPELIGQLRPDHRRFLDRAFGQAGSEEEASLDEVILSDQWLVDTIHAIQGKQGLINAINKYRWAATAYEDLLSSPEDTSLSIWKRDGQRAKISGAYETAQEGLTKKFLNTAMPLIKQKYPNKDGDRFVGMQRLSTFLSLQGELGIPFPKEGYTQDQLFKVTNG